MKFSDDCKTDEEKFQEIIESINKKNNGFPRGYIEFYNEGNWYLPKVRHLPGEYYVCLNPELLFVQPDNIKIGDIVANNSEPFVAGVSWGNKFILTDIYIGKSIRLKDGKLFSDTLEIVRIESVDHPDEDYRFCRFVLPGLLKKSFEKLPEYPGLIDKAIKDGLGQRRYYDEFDNKTGAFRSHKTNLPKEKKQPRKKYGRAIQIDKEKK